MELLGQFVQRLVTGCILNHEGQAIDQVVSRWLPTSPARVRARVRSCGICSGQNDTGLGFLLVLWFPLPILILPMAPLPILILPIAPQSPSCIDWGCYNMLIMAAVPSGLSLTWLRIKKVRAGWPRSRSLSPCRGKTFLLSTSSFSWPKAVRAWSSG
jgi:hypothetical protein